MFRLVLTIVLAVPAVAQTVPGLGIPPSGNNQKAFVTQFIGPVRITIDYSSPAVHGPDGKDRRGQITIGIRAVLFLVEAPTRGAVPLRAGTAAELQSRGSERAERILVTAKARG